MQIPQQHRRAGPLGHQTNHPSDIRIQVVLECMNHHRRNRNHAHDPQGADGLPRRQNHVCSQPVLQPRSLVTSSTTQFLSARISYCDTTRGCPLEIFDGRDHPHRLPRICPQTLKPRSSFAGHRKCLCRQAHLGGGSPWIHLVARITEVSTWVGSRSKVQ